MWENQSCAMPKMHSTALLQMYCQKLEVSKEINLVLLPTSRSALGSALLSAAGSTLRPALLSTARPTLGSALLPAAGSAFALTLLSTLGLAFLAAFGSFIFTHFLLLTVAAIGTSSGSC